MSDSRELIIRELIIPSRERPTSTGIADSAAHNKLGAINDAHAVVMWLSERAVGTRREYERHSRRLLAWLESVHLSLNTCTYEHLRKYFDQLDDLTLLQEHISRFIAREKQAHFSRLFGIKGGGVIETPHRAARSREVIVALFRWLQTSGYVSKIAIPKVQAIDNSSGDAADPTERTEKRREQLAMRVLADHQWAIVDLAINTLDWENELQSRCRAVAMWLRESGARRQELATARLSAMQRHSDATDKPPIWLWRIVGKGKKVRYVAVTPLMIDSFKRYRLAQGIPFFEDDPFLVPLAPGDIATHQPDTFLFYGLYGASTDEDASTLVVQQHRRRSGARSISSTTIYNDIKSLAIAAAAMCKTETDRARVTLLTPHWFRHRRALELTKKRVSLVQVAQYLGHARVETTKAYSFEEEVDLARMILDVDRKPTPMASKTS